MGPTVRACRGRTRTLLPRAHLKIAEVECPRQWINDFQTPDPRSFEHHRIGAAGEDRRPPVLEVPAS